MILKDVILLLALRALLHNFQISKLFLREGNISCQYFYKLSRNHYLVGLLSCFTFHKLLSQKSVLFVILYFMFMIAHMKYNIYVRYSCSVLGS